ncbi:DAK2 domain-containing protein [Micromonospora sp. WMMD812]|uniref:DAK2 domain-containing protein n=1 Tax=Micromonospora sp. WMMD812 TaxID=3015152 RepID=UPI00248D2B79|nr:DAK2 domain-containing protein [Micromonospora sp. WMMD812]WBB70470.1 DAK2 domain-containing protein [Micromonospora sp. WMMD812]
MLDTLDAAAVRRWCAGGLAALKRHQTEIDQLNVYPVPDGDTGTNLVLTLTSAQQALAMDLDTLPDGEATPHGHALRLMARGALLGARGNSGVILSQILRGFADAAAVVPALRGRELAAALRDATAAAYTAVARPVEGTLLSVVAAAATGAERADSDDLCAVAGAAAGEAAEALARTPEQLPALARAGVVDAGGRGLCLLLDALVEVVTGERPARVAPAPRASASPATAVRETGSDRYAYEVQFLLDAGPEAVDRMRDVLAGLGDSLVIVGDGAGPAPTWNVHVHVNDVGAAIEAGVVAGRPHQISVTRFADQTPPVLAPAARSAVVVAPGAGIAELFGGEGATVVPGNPSTGELLDAIRATGAARVVVLPNDPNTQAVAGAAAKEAHRLGVKVSVVPTRSPVQALAALAVRDSGRRFEDDVIAMAEAAGACRYAEVCYASREALTVAGPCQPGDVLALVDGEVHLIGTDLTDTCAAVVDRMLGGGGELVTLISGADAPAGLVEAISAHVGQHWPFVEVQAYPGGQPRYPLLVGVE